MRKKFTEEQQDAEVLRVIKAIGFPISARALHEIFRDHPFSSVMVNQSVWRHINFELQFDDEMKIVWVTSDHN
jgi:hypothetical protein